MLRALLTIPVLLSVTGWPILAENAPSVSSGLVIIAVKFQDGTTDVGTGFFADHDGLIVTADHVLRGATVVPNESGQVPPSNRSAQHLTLYLLSGTRTVDTDIHPGDIVFGSSKSGYLDIAMFRIPFDDQLRLQVQPLDISMDVPKQGQTLFAFGPACSPVGSDNSECHTAGPQVTILNNEPNNASTYDVSALLSLGFSGGPLVDASGRVVGICSQGKTLTLTQVVARSSYTPAIYLANYFQDRAPISQYFSGPGACDNAHKLASLTFFDFQELAVPWRRSPGALSDSATCTCCCESLSHSSNATLYTSLVGSCSPPFCLTQRVKATEKAVRALLNQKTPDFASLASSYAALRKLITEMKSSASIDLPTRTRTFIEYASLATEVSALPEQPYNFAGKADLFGARSDAATAYVYILDSLDTPSEDLPTHIQVYRGAGTLFLEAGNTRGLQAARVMEDLSDTSDSTSTDFDENAKHLSIKPKKLLGILVDNLKAIAHIDRKGLGES